MRWPPHWRGKSSPGRSPHPSIDPIRMDIMFFKKPIRSLKCQVRSGLTSSSNMPVFNTCEPGQVIDLQIGEFRRKVSIGEDLLG